VRLRMKPWGLYTPKRELFRQPIWD
jgi:hypothetical protein